MTRKSRPNFSPEFRLELRCKVNVMDKFESTPMLKKELHQALETGEFSIGHAKDRWHDLGGIC